MGDFTDDLRNEDPVLLGRLRTMLGSGAAPRPRPTCEERFGAAASGRTPGGPRRSWSAPQEEVEGRAEALTSSSAAETA